MTYISKAHDYLGPDATPAAKIAHMESRDRLEKNKRIAAKLPVRYLVRDDGIVYGWNEKLASNPRFRVVGELPSGFVEKREALRVRNEAQKVASKEHREKALNRLAEERKRRAEVMLAAKTRDVNEERSAEAQAEAEEAFIKTANADALREFALTNYDVRLPIGEVDLMRDAVIQMWMGGPAFEVGEPETWNDRNVLVQFAKAKLFRKMFRGVTLEKAAFQVREWLDSYNKPVDV